jgi:nucleoside-diphosphate-sugar epimerase
MKVIITGANGFIGSYLAGFFAQRTHCSSLPVSFIRL